MWLDSKAVNCPQKWGNFRCEGFSSCIAESRDQRYVRHELLPEQLQRDRLGSQLSVNVGKVRWGTC